ncbi:MAG: hypothetical protein KDD85_03575 [Parvularculaceae bacterium]|nr:hypothetical protein [Parvularculaceae bacterium]
MAREAADKIEEPLDWRRRFALESRRFNAWWEGYAFDASEVRALLAEEALSDRAPAGPPEQNIALSIWGEDRLEPGDPAWTMRHARTLGVTLKARIVVLGAGLGGPVRDLKNGTRWKLSGYARIAEPIKSLDIIPYDAALSRINRASADGGISFFELHRDPDPAMMALFAAELVKANAPFAFVDFTVARRGARLRPCFPEPWSGAPRLADQLADLIDKSGFRVNDVVDETRAFLPLVSRGWSHWRAAYARVRDITNRRQRAEHLRLLAQYAHLWAERFDAIKAGQLQVTRILARRKG